jgi:peroxiredoxin
MAVFDRGQPCHVMLVLGAALSSLVPGPAAFGAQAAPASGGTIAIPNPATALLYARSVQRELGLDEEHVAAVQAAASTVDLPLWRLRHLPAEQRDEAARPLLRQLRQRLSGILSARQIERFDQIVLQAHGISGLLHPETAARLRLSPTQVGAIQRIVAALNERLVAWQRTRDLAQAQQIRAQAEQEMLAVLDTQQRRTLAALTGPPCDMSRVRNVACRAPELRGVETWINSSPVTLAQLRGKVVALHFYAFGCVNCVRNLPYYNGWHARFSSDRFAVIGIHRPETEQERDISAVRGKAIEAGMKYPIAIDNQSQNWDAWDNRVWPSVYLIDRNGFVRYWWYGELNWQGTEGEKWMRARLAELLAERD